MVFCTAPLGSTLYAALIIAASSLLLLNGADALRKYHPSEVKASQDLWTKAAGPALTSYGRPVAELFVKPTAVDHFSKVCAAFAEHSCTCASLLQSFSPGSCDQSSGNAEPVYSQRDL